MEEKVADEPVVKGRSNGRKRMLEIMDLDDLDTYDNNDHSRIV